LCIASHSSLVVLRLASAQTRELATRHDRSGYPSEIVKRAMLLVDRETNRGANLIFCETEDDLRRADAALNQMTPASGRGTRTSVEMYEVAVDERLGG
jgi:hypothetical protein